MQIEAQRAVIASRAARAELAGLRLRVQHARLAMQWQRIRAKRQVAQLGRRVEAISETLSSMGPSGRSPIRWEPVDGALDDVLSPLD
jgi:hypothetical protein